MTQDRNFLDTLIHKEKNQVNAYQLQPVNVSQQCCHIQAMFPWLVCSTCCDEVVTVEAALSVCQAAPPAQPAVPAASLSPSLTASSATAAGAASPPSPRDPAVAWSGLPLPLH